jgi:hypothetical protein
MRYTLYVGIICNQRRKGETVFVAALKKYDKTTEVIQYRTFSRNIILADSMQIHVATENGITSCLTRIACTYMHEIIYHYHIT